MRVHWTWPRVDELARSVTSACSPLLNSIARLLLRLCQGQLLSDALSIPQRCSIVL